MKVLKMISYSPTTTYFASVLKKGIQW